MASLIGTKPNQVPTNGDLGTLAFQNHESVRVISLTADTVLVSGAPTTDQSVVTKQYVDTLANIYLLLSGGTMTGPLNITAGTVTTSTPLLNMAQTWNAAAVQFTGVKLNITDTASTSTSLLVDLQVGGASKFSVSKTGSIVIAGSSIQLGTGAVGEYIRFGAGNTYIINDANNTVALRNGSNAQTFRVYNSYTDANNYERLSMGWAANSLSIKTESAGTGVARSLSLEGGDGYVNVASHLVPSTTGKDLGSTTSRWSSVNAFRKLTVAGASLSGLSDPMLNLAQIWNDAAVAFTAIKSDVTNTASAAASLLMDLQVNSVSRFKIGTGVGRASIIGNSLKLYHDTSDAFMSEIIHMGNESLHIRSYGNNVLMLSGLDFAPNVQLRFDHSLGWSSTTGQTQGDLRLYRDAANTLAQRNGVNQQTLRIYSTYTDVNNYARAKLSWDANDFVIGTEALGTGTVGNIKLNAASTSVSGDLIVSGNLTVHGASTIVNSTTISIDDPIFTLGGDTIPTADDNKDRGIEFRWHDGVSAKLGFFGFDDSAGKFTFIPDATNTSEVFAGTKGTLDATIEWADVLNKPDPVITLAGDLTGSVTLTDLGSGTLTATIAPNSVALGTDTTGNYVSSLTSGTGISVAGTVGEGWVPTITNTDPGSAQMIFKNIAVLGQTTITPNNNNSTLTFAAGTNITITTDATNDVVTISANDTVVDWSEIQNKPDPIITLAGDLTGSVTLTDLASGTLTATIAPNSVALGIDTTGDYVAALTAGTGISITGVAGEAWSPVVTNTDPGSSQFIFKNIAVAGQTTVVADNNNDTLTLIAGTNITITTDALTDAITINADDVSVDWTQVQNKPDPVITLAGDLSGSVTLTDLASGTLTATIVANSVALGTDTVGNYAASVGVSGNGLSITGAAGEGTAFTVNSNATSVNTASTIVFRDASGNFSVNEINASAVIIDNLTTSNAVTVTTSSTTTTELASFAVANYGSGDFVIQATQGTLRQITKVLVLHDGTTASSTEYGTMATGAALFSVSVDISAGNLRVLVTSSSATSTVYKASFTLIGA